MNAKIMSVSNPLLTTILCKRDKANLDIFWLKDESLEDTDNLPAPEVLAVEIAENPAISA